MTDLTHTPDWVKNAIFYQIFPDRFAKSDKLEKPNHIEPWDAPMTRHGFKGGDLLGVPGAVGDSFWVFEVVRIALEVSWVTGDLFCASGAAEAGAARAAGRQAVAEPITTTRPVQRAPTSESLQPGARPATMQDTLPPRRPEPTPPWPEPVPGRLGESGMG